MFYACLAAQKILQHPPPTPAGNYSRVDNLQIQNRNEPLFSAVPNALLRDGTLNDRSFFLDDRGLGKGRMTGGECQAGLRMLKGDRGGGRRTAVRGSGGLAREGVATVGKMYGLGPEA